jgi:hypothetical protein
VGDTPAAWHHYFRALAPFIEPVRAVRGQASILESGPAAICDCFRAPRIAACSRIVKNMYMLQGYFVDVGAGDGVFASNTFFLERQRCWKGIAIEPAAKEYPKLEHQRPGCTVVSCPLPWVQLLNDTSADRGCRRMASKPHCHSLYL